MPSWLRSSEARYLYLPEDTTKVLCLPRGLGSLRSKVVYFGQVLSTIVHFLSDLSGEAQELCRICSIGYSPLVMYTVLYYMLVTDVPPSSVCYLVY